MAFIPLWDVRYITELEPGGKVVAFEISTPGATAEYAVEKCEQSREETFTEKYPEIDYEALEWRLAYPPRVINGN